MALHPEDTNASVGEGLEALDQDEALETLSLEPEDENEIYAKWIKDLLTDLVKDYRSEEEYTREIQIREWKKLLNYWDSIQNIFWSQTSNDWMTPADVNVGGVEGEEVDDLYFNKVMNVYRAYGESIVSALSVDIPKLVYLPDDADSDSDITTAKGFQHLSHLIIKHNKAKLLFIKAIYILFNQGVVFSYNYSEQDESFGTFQQEDTQEQELLSRNFDCPGCGDTLLNHEIQPNEVNADVEQIPQFCPECQQMVLPDISDTAEIVPQSETEDIPKVRELIKLYGPLNVTIPHYATEQKEFPFLFLDTEHHITAAQEIYQEIADKMVAGGDLERHQRWSRTAVQMDGSSSISENGNIVTISQCWLRPSAFNDINEDDQIDFIRENFPEGVYCVFVDDELAFLDSESMDDHWTASISPISGQIHAAPMGRVLVDIQDMTNEVINLTLETIEHGIPITFADPRIINFNKFNKTVARPGQIIPARNSTGRTIGEGFAQLKTSTVSGEIERFADNLTTSGQFVIGAFPSIYGGSLPTGSRTAAEYQLSRNQALQRLQTVFNILADFWAETMGKAIKGFVNNMKEFGFDERIVKSTGNSFVNVWIRRTDLEGNMGSIEPESTGQFPVSWAEQRGVLMELLTMNNPEINASLFHPENLGTIARLIGLPNLHIPGDDDRTKQLQEIGVLLRGQAVSIPAKTENDEEFLIPSVPIDIALDNHAVEAETCKAFLISEVGQDLKNTNIEGYINILAHFKAHQMVVQLAIQAEKESGLEDEVGPTGG